MLNLDNIQSRIDRLWETETSDTLSDWLFKKRLADINTIIGDGEFVSIPTKHAHDTFVSEPQHTNFIAEDNDFDPVPPYRQAA